MDLLCIARHLFVAALIVVTSVIRHHHHDCEGHAVIGENSVECLVHAFEHSSHHSHSCDTRCSMHIGAHMTKRIASSSGYVNFKILDFHDIVRTDEAISVPLRIYEDYPVEADKSLIIRYICATGGFRAPPVC